MDLFLFHPWCMNVPCASSQIILYPLYISNIVIVFNFFVARYVYKKCIHTYVNANTYLCILYCKIIKLTINKVCICTQQTWSGFSPTTVPDNNRQSGLSPTTVPKMSTGYLYQICTIMCWIICWCYSCHGWILPGTTNHENCTNIKKAPFGRALNLKTVSRGLLGPRTTWTADIFVIGWSYLLVIFLWRVF